MFVNISANIDEKEGVGKQMLHFFAFRGMMTDKTLLKSVV